MSNKIKNIFIFLGIFFISINFVSATLEINGADDYNFAFDPDTAYQVSEFDVVNPASGTFMIKNEDVNIKGINGLDLILNRYYNSGVWINRIDGDDYDDEVGQLQEFSYLGVGWQPFNFGSLRLSWSDGPTNDFFYPEGSYIEFGDGSQYRIYLNEEGDDYLIKNHLDWNLEVVPSGNPDWPNYELTKEDGTKYFFDGLDCMILSTEVAYYGYTTNTGFSKYCQVNSIEDTHGNTIEINYMPVPFGEYNEILPQNHRAINYIVDTVGREVHFNYDIYEDLYITWAGQNYYLEHYILDKITYDNANSDEITVDYEVTQIDDGPTGFSRAHTPYWAWYTYRLDKVEIKKGNELLKPAQKFYYNEFGVLDEVIYEDVSELPDSHLIEDMKVKYYFDEIKHQYSDLAQENIAGYSLRLDKKEVYDGMGNVAVWEYKYGVNDDYWNSNSNALTQRTFLHCDDNTPGDVTNCASNSNTGRVGPVENGGSVLNFYKQVKIINPDDSYSVNYYFGTDYDINYLNNMYVGFTGWPRVRDTAGTLKENHFYNSDGILLNKKTHSYDFLGSEVSNQNTPHNDYYRSRLVKMYEYTYDELGNFIYYWNDYSYDGYDNLKYSERGYSGGLYHWNALDYLHESNTGYEEANILNKIDSNEEGLKYAAPCLYSYLVPGKTYREVDYYYDNDFKGDLIKEKKIGLNSADTDSIIEYEYDGYGNVLNVEDPNNNYFYTRYEYNDYPSFGWNDVFGDENDPAWENTYYNNGFLESKTDKNGNLVEYYYDDLDRLVKTVEFGDSFSEPTSEYFYYDFENKLKVREKLDDETYREIFYFYDGLGRLIQTKEQNVNGFIVVSTEYDELGRNVKQSKPYNLYIGSVGEYTLPSWPSLISSDLVVQYEYDSLGRITKIINSDETEINYKYGPDWKIVTDEKGIKKLFRYDKEGRIIEVEENYIECLDGQTKPCSLQLGVCSDDVQECSNGVWSESCVYTDKSYSEAYDCDDGLDNDCDGLIDDEDPDCNYCGIYGQTTNFCMKQAGVCENSEGSIHTAYSGPIYYQFYYCTDNDYGLDYQRKETNCDDNLDNDCDGLVDGSDYDCVQNRIITLYSYDIMGNLIRIVDAEGKVTRYYYDSFGNQIYSINQDIGLVEKNYDVNGNLVYKITNNVLKNSNFERHSEFWDMNYFYLNHNGGYFGTHSVKINSWGFISQEENILGNEDYIFSSYSKSDNRLLSVRIWLYDEYGGEIESSQVNIGDNWIPCIDYSCWESSMEVDEEYSRIIFDEFTTPENAYKIRLDIGSFQSGSGDLYIDAIQLEKGNEAKPYSLTLYDYNGINDLVELTYLGNGEGLN
ncbi:MAG: hypothetical protein KJ674_00625 [Nanoarchaeota archaeon]|nr:hypothetical protein [Nanoarchaeota archaeon]